MKVFMMQLWNISYQAAMIICIILLVRQIFSWMKVPKKISYCLWLIPFLRMLCPWTIESTFSLLPIREVNQVVGQVMEYTDTGNAGMLQQDGNPAPGQRIPVQILPAGSLLPVSGSPEPQRSAHEGWTWITIAGGIWLSGVLVLLCYSLVSYWKLKKRLIGSICRKENVYLADHIATPFVFGVWNPRIYLPSGIGDQEYDYVVAHEQVHIQRKDYWIKLIAFFAVCLHWFNPLAWLAYFCMEKDMELSCDEAVIRLLGEHCRQAYAAVLLDFAVDKKRVSGMPLAFGEGNTKTRIIHIMKYKKPLWITVVLAILILIVLAAGLLTSPKPDTVLEPEEQFGAVTAPEELDSSQDDNDKIQEENINPVTDIVAASLETMELDYAGNGKVIFHNDFGLFISSISSEQDCNGSINLEDIAPEGEKLDVRVTQEGERIYLLPYSQKKEMYVFDVEQGRLFRQNYDVADAKFFDRFGETDQCLMDEYIGYRSARCIVFENENERYYGYLSSGTNEMNDLYYIEADRAVKLFGNDPFGMQDEIENEALNSGLYAMTFEEDSLTPEGGTIQIFNHSSQKEITFSDDFHLSRLVKGEWESVPYVIDNWGFHQPAYPVAPGEMRTMDIDWKWLYGSLPAGTYFLKKTVLILEEEGGYDEVELGVQFTLK